MGAIKCQVIAVCESLDWALLVFTGFDN